MTTKEGLVFRSTYWDDHRAREQFKEFLISIHGLDLSLWEQKGYWDEEHYTAFSFFEGDRVVATTNLFSMEMVVEGGPRKLGQFSGVGTLPEFRGRGLNRRLTEIALGSAAETHDGFFLFADKHASGFYEKCGFRPVAETITSLAVGSQLPEPGLRKLDPESDDDLGLVYRLACERSPVSDLLGVLNPKLLMFHCLYTLRDCMYFVADLDVAVFFEVNGKRLTLFDVVGERIPSFAELHPYLSVQPHNEVLFSFMRDKLGVDATGQTALKDSGAHILPPLRLPEPARLFPFVSHA